MLYTLEVHGVFPVNCYAIIDQNSQHGWLVDPGAQGEEILHTIRQQGWHIEKILLTHGHFDHTGAVSFLQEELKVPVLIHAAGQEYLQDTWLNLSRQCRQHIVVNGTSFIHDGDIIALANGTMSLKVIHTPGHTPDSVIFYNAAENWAIVGDTIFRGAVGSTEYPGGNKHGLMQSLKKIFTLPQDTILYSGHSQPTMIAHEAIMRPAERHSNG